MSDRYIDIGLGGSGWFAVLIIDDVPYQDGIGRYKTSRGAIAEARQWSVSDEIPLHKDLVLKPRRKGKK